MDIDGTSSASSDSSPSQFTQNLNIGTNFYNDNMYFSPNSKKSELDNFFNKDFYSGDKTDRKIDVKCNKKTECYSGEKHNFCASANNNNNNNNVNDSNKSGSEQYAKRGALFAQNYGKKVDEFVDRKAHSNYFKKATENANIHLNNLDLFGKKTISFSADQVLFSQ